MTLLLVVSMRRGALIPGCAVYDGDLQLRTSCFDPKTFRQKVEIDGCESASLEERNGFLYQVGGPPMVRTSACSKPRWVRKTD